MIKYHFNFRSIINGYFESISEFINVEYIVLKYELVDLKRFKVSIRDIEEYFITRVLSIFSIYYYSHLISDKILRNNNYVLLFLFRINRCKSLLEQFRDIIQM